MHQRNLHHVAAAAAHLSELLPPSGRDDVSVSTYLRRPDELVLMVVLPPNLSHMRNRLPKVIDGVEVLYQVADPLKLN